MWLNPAASHNTIASFVALATPPRAPAVAVGRMKALGCLPRLTMRVLSPRMAPWCLALDGSTARIATFAIGSFSKRYIP